MRVDSGGPSIEDLRAFLLLDELLGVAEVARRLRVDVSVVSRRLKPFREPYGLLRKQGGSLVFTDRGRALLPTIRAILHGYDGLAGQLRLRTPDGPSLTIAVGGFGAASLIPEVVARFAVEAPDSTIRNQGCRGRERIQGMIDGRFDLAVLSHSLEQIRPMLGDGTVAVELLPGRPFVVIARRESPTAAALGLVPQDGMATIRDLAKVTLVGLDESSGVRTQLDRQAADAGVRLRFGATGGGWLAAREYARHGLGAAIVPVEALGDVAAEEFLVRRLDRPLWPGDHLLHRPADAERVASLRATLIATAADQSRRQLASLGRFDSG